MSLQDSVSLWNASAVEHNYTAPLDADTTVDVAIVGGGFTGLSTALHCAEKGLSAHVLEAEQIGFGGSGRNCGLVNAALWLPPQKCVNSSGLFMGHVLSRCLAAGQNMSFRSLKNIRYSVK